MSFEIAQSGINAINGQLDSISNNIANTSTYGYKSSRANFAASYAGTQATGVELASQTQNIGKGGSIQTTGRALDAAINGRGFFVTKDGSGAQVYSRVGIFSTNKDGTLVDNFGRRVQGYPAQVAKDGSTSIAKGGMGDIKVPQGQVAAKASDMLNYSGNMSAGWSAPASATFSKDDPQSYNSASVSSVYDSLGNKHSLTQYFAHAADNSVTVHYTFDGKALGTTNTLKFDTNGNLISPDKPVAIACGTPQGAEPLTINTNYKGTTQYAGNATEATNSSNGYASGTLTGVQLESSGNVTATYSNGQKQTFGAVVLATFPNENGLSTLNDTSWGETSASGTPLIDVPGSGLVGTLATSSLEGSNVDITSQLVNLMTAQRSYQANSKVISTENQMMQALMQAL